MSINGPKLLFMNVLVIYLCFYGLKVAKDVIGSFQSTYEISKTLSNLAQKDEKHKKYEDSSSLINYICLNYAGLLCPVHLQSFLMIWFFWSLIISDCSCAK